MRKKEESRGGEGNPETFDFLGFTFYCGENQVGKFCVKPKTNGKRMAVKIKEMKQWLKRNRTTPLKVLMPMLNRKLIGYYRYYGMTYNVPSLIKYHYYITQLLYRWMNRRSQKKSYNWEGFKQMLEYYPLAYPKRYYNLYAELETVNVIMKSRMRESRTYGSVIPISGLQIISR